MQVIKTDVLVLGPSPKRLLQNTDNGTGEKRIYLTCKLFFFIFQVSILRIYYFLNLKVIKDNTFKTYK